MRLTTKKGVTLVEMLLAAVILAYAVCGILALHVSCFDLVSTSKNISIAVNASQGLMEEIRNASFPQIFDNYNNLNFTVNTMSSNRGVVYVDDTDPELLRVTISVCWNQRNRIIGEDRNLNGALEAGEDANNNGVIDSPAQLVTLVANR